MLSTLQDALLLLLLPLAGGFVGGFAVFLMTTRRAPAPARVEPSAAVVPPPVERRAPARVAMEALVSRWTSRLPAVPELPRAADLLLVDDSAVARAKLRRLFERAGYEVHLASDGLSASVHT